VRHAGSLVDRSLAARDSRRAPEMKRSYLWAAALMASGIVHAGVAALFLRQPAESAMEEGAAGIEVALMGEFEAMTLAGEPDDVVDPIDPIEQSTDPGVAPTSPDAIQPTLAEPAETPQPQKQATAAPTQPVEVEPTPQPVERVAEAVPVQTLAALAVAVSPLPSDVYLPPPLQETVPAEEPAAPQAVAPVEPVQEAIPQPPPEPTQIVETALAVTPPPVSAVERVEPAEAIEEVAVPEKAPVPMPRPAQPVREALLRAEPPKQQQTKPQKSDPQKQPERKPPAKRPAGDGGQNDREAQRGRSDGSDVAQAASNGTGSKSNMDGNAAVSNYPGKVRAKLRRTWNGVSRATRRGGQREVHVSFVVDLGGGLGSVRIIQSSGSGEVDSAAMESVRRAAPFPPIPTGAGRTRWEFTIPLALR